MNLKLKIANILFLDIETVPLESNWNSLSEAHQNLFKKKHNTNAKKKLHQNNFMKEQVFGQNLVKLFVFQLGIFQKINLE